MKRWPATLCLSALLVATAPAGPPSLPSPTPVLLSSEAVRQMQTGLVSPLWTRPLPAYKGALQAAVVENRLVLLGNRLPGDVFSQASVELNDTGTSGTWEVAPLPAFAGSYVAAIAAEDGSTVIAVRKVLEPAASRRYELVEFPLRNGAPRIVGRLPIPVLENEIYGEPTLAMKDRRLFVAGPQPQSGTRSLKPAPESSPADIAMFLSDRDPDGAFSKWESAGSYPQPRANAALLLMDDLFILAGGEVPAAGGGKIAPRETMQAFLKNSRPTTWTMMGQALPHAIGKVRGTSFLGLAVLLSETPLPAKDGAMATSQTLTLSTERGEGGYMSLWNDFTLNYPAIQGFHVVPNPAANQVLLVGGQVLATGKPLQQIAGFGLPVSPVRLAEKEQEARALSDANGFTEQKPIRAPGVDPETFTAASRKAAAGGSYQLVLFLAEDADSQEFRRTVLRNDAFRAMTMNVVVSEPVGDEVGAALAAAGNPSRPSCVLLDPSGKVVDKLTGKMTRADMFNLLKRTYEAPEASPTPAAATSSKAP